MQREGVFSIPAVLLIGFCGWLAAPPSTGSTPPGTAHPAPNSSGPWTAAGSGSSEIRVPDDFPTIQGAIDAAADGAIIVVGPGRWTGPIDFRGKGILLRSRSGPAVTVLDGAGAGPVVHFPPRPAESVPAAELEGFTVTGGDSRLTSGYGGGLWIEGSSPTVRDCVIEGNRALRGGGIAVESGASMPRIESTVIRNNESDVGGGLSVASRSHPRLSDCVLEGNRAGEGGGIWAFSSSVVSFVDGVIEGNEATFDGGGGHSYWYGWLNLGRTVVRGNRSAVGGGVSVGTRGLLVSSTSLFAANVAAERGGAVDVLPEGGLSMEFATVASNEAPAGGGIAVSPAALQLRLLSVVVYGNRVPALLPVLPSPPSGVEYSDVEGGAPGIGNIDADPLFRSVPRGDFHLSAGSPAIDSGWPDATAGVEDLEGRARPAGDGFDMGAYESPAKGRWVGVAGEDGKLVLGRRLEAAGLPSDDVAAAMQGGDSVRWESLVEGIDRLRGGALDEVTANELILGIHRLVPTAPRR